MGILSKGDEGNDPMDEQSPSGEPGPGERNKKSDKVEKNEVIEYQTPRTAASGLRGGFFHIYKPGQGYWTRMGTAAAVVIVLLLLGQLLYRTISLYTELSVGWVWGIVGVLAVVVAVLVWRILNKASVVDFMIATESEMKKVNWTSRKELIGSTKVVIVFMFLIAACLFIFDIFFGYMFYFMNVLEFEPIWG